MVRAAFAIGAITVVGAIAVAGSFGFAGTRRVAGTTPMEARPTSATVSESVSKGVPESDAAHLTGERLVKAGLAAHTWTANDVRELRRLMPQMTQTQREALLHMLLPAINRGAVTVTAAGRPF